MGATLPALARCVKATNHNVSRFGYLYAGNIAGAVFGCLLSGFYLLRDYDVTTATLVAATINAAVAGFALLLATYDTPGWCCPCCERDCSRRSCRLFAGLRRYRVVRVLRARGRIDLDALTRTAVWRLCLHAVHHSRCLSGWSRDRQQHRLIACSKCRAPTDGVGMVPVARRRSDRLDVLRAVRLAALLAHQPVDLLGHLVQLSTRP